MKASILFAEDDLALQHLVTEQLREDGYAVTPVDNGIEALKRVEHDRFDLALLDIRMPGKDGMEVLQGIRVLAPLTRVVMLTGVDEFSVAMEAIRLGANDYITKPFSLRDLLSCIGRALER